MSKSFRRYLSVKRRVVRRVATGKTPARFSRERLERRINPSVTADLTGGVLTVSSNAASDNILITDLDADGSVDVDDLNTVGVDFANLGAITSVTSITVTGGDGNDTIVLQGTDSLGAGDLAGVAYTISGGVGGDSIDASDMTAGGSVSGDSENDTISTGLGNDTIDGGTGTDLVVAAGDVDFTLSNTSLDGLGSDGLTSIELANLTGGAGANTIDASAFSGA